VIAAALVLALATGAETAPAAPAEAAAPDRAALVAGKIPDGPERTTLEGRCLICHTLDYVTTQRLTEGQWTNVVNKMKRWGSPVADDEVKPLAAWLATHWPTDLPERTSPRMAAPPGSTPAPAKKK
jgi:hypothetical protein